MVVQHLALLRKLALNVEDFYVKTIGWGLKNHVFDHEALKSGLFQCYRLKINDFLSSCNQHLKIDIFKSLQQIPCYCKSRLGTLRLISWWRVTYMLHPATQEMLFVFARPSSMQSVNQGRMSLDDCMYRNTSSAFDGMIVLRVV